MVDKSQTLQVPYLFSTDCYDSASSLAITSLLDMQSAATV